MLTDVGWYSAETLEPPLERLRKVQQGVSRRLRRLGRYQPFAAVMARYPLTPRVALRLLHEELAL